MTVKAKEGTEIFGDLLPGVKFSLGDKEYVKIAWLYFVVRRQEGRLGQMVNAISLEDGKLAYFRSGLCVTLLGIAGAEIHFYEDPARIPNRVERALRWTQGK